MGMKNVTIKTVVNEKFRFKAMDLNGAVFVFEDKPSIPIDIACDTWDVKEGEILQVTQPVFLSAEGITHTGVGSELGDWRDSLIELNNETIS